MNIFVAYQNIDSGAKVATEHVVESFRKKYPKVQLTVYKQNPYTFSGFLSFTRNFFWSIQDFRKQINKAPHIHAIYSPYYLVKLAQLFSQKRKIPFYFHLHGDQAITEKEQEKIEAMSLKNAYTKIVHSCISVLQKMALKKAKKVFFVSEQAKKEFLQKNVISLPKNKSVIVPNGVSLKKFFPISEREKQRMKKRVLGIHSETTLISYIGRIDHKKGILELIQSLPILSSFSSEKITLLVIYPNIPDTYSQKYLALLKQAAYQTPYKIIFKKNPQNLVQYYQISDLIILPSYQEMMPLVMLEAFACHIPFIGSKAGNMKTIVSKIHPHLLLKNITPREIAQKIHWFLKLPEAHKKRIQQKQKALAEAFSWEKAAGKILNTLQNPQL